MSGIACLPAQPRRHTPAAPSHGDSAASADMPQPLPAF